MKFIVKRAVDKSYYFVIVASNGETIAQSETYVDKASALSTIYSLRSGAASATVEDKA